MSYNDKVDYLAMILGVFLLFIFFLFSGGGSLLDKWIDGIKVFVNRMFDFLPIRWIKTVRILWYVIYAAVVIFIFTRITD